MQRKRKTPVLLSAFFAIFVSALLFYYFLLSPLVEWVNSNVWLLITAAIISVISSIVLTQTISLYKKKRAHRQINRIIKTIKIFQPFRRYDKELPYQIDLARYLKTHFPHAVIEESRESARPDIVIENIAIEVKGPTKSHDLNTIADKCMRYAYHFPEGVIIVLFSVKIHPKRYIEWVRLLKRQFPNIQVIRK